jgi:hypothetical protein
MIPAGIVIVLLMILFWIKIPSLVIPLWNWLMERNTRPSAGWIAAGVFLILGLTGALLWGITVLVSWLEEKYQPPAEPADVFENEIDDILYSVEKSLARIKESSEKMKIQTERILELNRRFLDAFPLRSPDPQNVGEIPLSPGTAFRGQMITEKLVGSTDIFVLSGSREHPDQKGKLLEYRNPAPEKDPEFIILIEKITHLLRYTIEIGPVPNLKF